MPLALFADMGIDGQFFAGFLVSSVLFVLSWILYHMINPFFVDFNKPERTRRQPQILLDAQTLSVGCIDKGKEANPNLDAKCGQKSQPILMRTVDSQADLNGDIQPLWLTPESSKASSPLPSQERSCRPMEELMNLLGQEDGIKEMTDEEIIQMLKHGKVRAHQLEKELGNELKAVHLRRKWLLSERNLDGNLDGIPYFNYDYSFVSNSCCENVIGYVPIPLGYIGPLRVNGESYIVPLATTEGCLVASTNRGSTALQSGEGVRASVKDLGMTRGPVVMFDRAEDALKAKCWLDRADNYNFRFIKQKFDSTSRFASLKEVKCNVAGRLLFMRFLATTGDAMGMNMVSKATDAALRYMRDQYFPNMRIISLSGNFCVDKKPAAVNWIDGRGKLVVCDAVIPAGRVRDVLKTDVDALVELNISKNMVGSAVAGSLGGFNAHAANIVTAIFLATGQDAAQTVSSSNCLTQVEKREGGDLYISVTLPCLEVGTVGGGTILPPQRACLEMMGVSGGGCVPGEKAAQLARLIGATVLAGELSLLAALSSGDLVKSHIRHNRSSINLRKVSQLESLRGDSMRKATSLGNLGKQLGDLAEASIKGSSMHPESCSKVLT